jgi:hypothetical protein
MNLVSFNRSQEASTRYRQVMAETKALSSMIEILDHNPRLTVKSLVSLDRS